MQFWDLDRKEELLKLHFADTVENIALSRDGASLLLSLSRGVLACLDIIGLR